MQWDLRALAQVEEELIKRWKDGDAKAHFEGIEQKAGLAPAAAENPPAPAGPDNPQP
jgi:hypothetical protein